MSLGVVAVVGLAVGVALFSLTSQVRILYTYSTPVCRPGEGLHVDQPGFDPITGEPYGRSFSCAGSGRTMSNGPEPELASHRAIPVPIGFLLGSGAAGLAILISVRPWRMMRFT